jgi:hypothetical protein
MCVLEAALGPTLFESLQKRENDLTEERTMRVLSRKTQNCKQCYRLLMRAFGCRHMTCFCGFQFWWGCGCVYIVGQNCEHGGYYKRITESMMVRFNRKRDADGELVAPGQLLISTDQQPLIAVQEPVSVSEVQQNSPEIILVDEVIEPLRQQTDTLGPRTIHLQAAAAAPQPLSTGLLRSFSSAQIQSTVEDRPLRQQPGTSAPPMVPIMRLQTAATNQQPLRTEQRRSALNMPATRLPPFMVEVIYTLNNTTMVFPSASDAAKHLGIRKRLVYYGIERGDKYRRGGYWFRKIE